MSVMESLVTRRTYRRFAQKPVPQDVVDDIVEAGRQYKFILSFIQFHVIIIYTSR